jgi:hypothetical protein
MANIGYSFSALNNSGDYTIQVKNCSGSTTIYTALITGQSSSGTVTGTLTNSSLNTNLGSIKLVIFDTNNNTVIGTSSCFNHNCSSCVSITDFTLATSNNIAYGATIDCTISGENGSTPHSYSLKLKQAGVTLDTNTDSSSNTFSFTRNVCPNLGTVTIEAQTTNCGAVITKTNTVTILAPTPPAPVLSVCYASGGQWVFTAAVGMFPESVLRLYEQGTDDFIAVFDGTNTSSRSVATSSVSIGGNYYAKLTTCNVTSGASNSVEANLTPAC